MVEEKKLPSNVAARLPGEASSTPSGPGKYVLSCCSLTLLLPCACSHSNVEKVYWMLQTYQGMAATTFRNVYSAAHALKSGWGVAYR